MIVMIVFSTVPRKVFTPNTKAHSSLVREEAIWKLRRKTQNELFRNKIQRTDVFIFLCYLVLVPSKTPHVANYNKLELQSKVLALHEIS